MDFLHDCGRHLHGKPAAAELFRNECGEKTGLRQRRDEFRRVAPLAVQFTPVLAGKFLAQRTHRREDLRKLFGLLAHARTSARPLFMATTLRSTTVARKLTTLPSHHISVRMVSPGNTGAENRPPNEVSRAGS